MEGDRGKEWKEDVVLMPELSYLPIILRRLDDELSPLGTGGENNDEEDMLVIETLFVGIPVGDCRMLHR